MRLILRQEPFKISSPGRPGAPTVGGRKVDEYCTTVVNKIKINTCLPRWQRERELETPGGDWRLDINQGVGRVEKGDLRIRASPEPATMVFPAAAMRARVGSRERQGLHTGLLAPVRLQ